MLEPRYYDINIFYFKGAFSVSVSTEDVVRVNKRDSISRIFIVMVLNLLSILKKNEYEINNIMRSACGDDIIFVRINTDSVIFYGLKMYNIFCS